MTATVEAGCSWSAMQAALARHGQFVALDPLWPDRATVGGIVATNDSGPLRLRYGSLRDLIIGMTIVLADGTIARTGGKVVKNVAGYDLHKLMTGAFGTLGIITEVTFRLHSVPRHTRSFTVTSIQRRPAGQSASQARSTLTRLPVHPIARVRERTRRPLCARHPALRSSRVLDAANRAPCSLGGKLCAHRQSRRSGLVGCVAEPDPRTTPRARPATKKFLRSRRRCFLRRSRASPKLSMGSAVSSVTAGYRDHAGEAFPPLPLEASPNSCRVIRGRGWLAHSFRPAGRRRPRPVGHAA